MTETQEHNTDIFGREINGRTLDTGGRITTNLLTDREIREETLATLRTIADAISAIGVNPAGMMARFMPGVGPAIAAVQNSQRRG